MLKQPQGLQAGLGSKGYVVCNNILAALFNLGFGWVGFFWLM